jgi:hypothetical protein
MNMTIHRTIFGSVFGAALLVAATTLSPVLATAEELSAADYIAAEDPPIFDDASKAVEALRTALAANDFDGVATLLGLDPAKLKAAEGVMDTYERIREGSAKQVVIEEAGDRRILKIGRDLWPLPFPVTKGGDGKWAFDTVAGIEEIINRRIGENELQAIATARAYVEAQRDYAAEDRDGDGVPEYAQKLLSGEGLTDGLYWPIEQGDGDSPAGSFVNEAQIDKSKEGNGYYGYRFRILTGQGDSVAGGKYSYIINDNMIAGFALIAWPAKYAETGVLTFVVNQAGIVYEKDLGADTEALAGKIAEFGPDDGWEVTSD